MVILVTNRSKQDFERFKAVFNKLYNEIYKFLSCCMFFAFVIKLFLNCTFEKPVFHNVAISKKIFKRYKSKKAIKRTMHKTLSIYVKYCNTLKNLISIYQYIANNTTNYGNNS